CLCDHHDFPFRYLHGFACPAHHFARARNAGVAGTRRTFAISVSVASRPLALSACASSSAKWNRLLNGDAEHQERGVVLSRVPAYHPPLETINTTAAMINAPVVKTTEIIRIAARRALRFGSADANNAIATFPNTTTALARRPIVLASMVG